MNCKSIQNNLKLNRNEKVLECSPQLVVRLICILFFGGIMLVSARNPNACFSNLRFLLCMLGKLICVRNVAFIFRKKGKFNCFQIMLNIAFCCQVFCLSGVGAVLSGDCGMPLKEISSCTTLMHISTIGGEVAMHKKKYVSKLKYVSVLVEGMSYLIRHCTPCLDQNRCC